MKKIITVKHSINLGDVIASLAGLKHLAETQNAQIHFYQVIGLTPSYYPGAKHPTTNANGEMVCMNQAMWDMLVPLLEHQPYIYKAEVYAGQKVDYDLDRIRGEVATPMPGGLIQKWLWMAYPELACDLSKPWLASDFPTPDTEHIVVNFTSRYRSQNLSYHFLRNQKGLIIFVGTPEEYEYMRERYGISNMEYYRVSDFLELAHLIATCKFFIGNQSFAWNIAEALKVPRMLEVCSWAPNCAGIGENAYDYMHQHALEYYFEKLNSLETTR